MGNAEGSAQIHQGGDLHKDSQLRQHTSDKTRKEAHRIYVLLEKERDVEVEPVLCDASGLQTHNNVQLGEEDPKWPTHTADKTANTERWL